MRIRNEEEEEDAWPRRTWGDTGPPPQARDEFIKDRGQSLRLGFTVPPVSRTQTYLPPAGVNFVDIFLSLSFQRGSLATIRNLPLERIATISPPHFYSLSSIFSLLSFFDQV